MERDPWRDPDIVCHAYDGVAWKIEQYSQDGALIRTSGKMNYIYGQAVLEAIVSLLPYAGEFDSSAYIRVLNRQHEITWRKSSDYIEDYEKVEALH